MPLVAPHPHHHHPSSSLFLVAVVFFAVLIVNVSGEVLTACYDEDGATDRRTLEVQCGQGSLIRILHTFYGFSPHGHCSYHPEDCTQQAPLPAQAQADCLGQSSCSLPLPGADTQGVLLPQCQRRSNYFQLEYQCVSRSELQDICSTSHLHAQSGHIVTPQFPLPFNARLDCALTIQVDPSQKIRLNLITMELRAQGKTDCADWLYFNDKFHSLTLCGRRANIWYTMHSHFLHVELQSLPHSTSQGFWLYYEADPLLPTQPPSTPPLPPATSSGARSPHQGGSLLLTSLSPHRHTPAPPRNPHPTTPIPIYHDNHDAGTSRGAKSLPFAIAGGVIGTLSLVLIVLLMLLLIKWLKERRYFNNEKFLEIRNPAFRSSGDFHDTNTAAYYN